MRDICSFAMMSAPIEDADDCAMVFDDALRPMHTHSKRSLRSRKTCKSPVATACAQQSEALLRTRVKTLDFMIEWSTEGPTAVGIRKISVATCLGATANWSVLENTSNKQSCL